MRDDHDPVVLVPDNFGIAELVCAVSKNWVFGIRLECVATVIGECYFLHLFGGSVERTERLVLALDTQEGCVLDRNHAVFGIIEESRGIVCIDHRRARENSRSRIRRVQRNGLIRPVVQIPRGSMSPVLVPGNETCRIV